MQTENSMSEHKYPLSYPTISQLDDSPDVKVVYAAVLFADIKGFTRFCQSVDLSTAFHTLSVFHQRMARVISSYAQTVTTKAGDEVMAAWCGEPSIVTTKALRCGFAMLETMRAWNNEDFSSRQALNIGIGVHAGPVVLGRIPGESRMSVFGDTVNTASRLEQMTRTYSTDLIASDELVSTAYSRTPFEVGPSRFCPSVTIKVRDRAGSLPIRIAV
ncbi:adenylate/guanylate cyclase domain-containing protein [Phyllobacterium sp. LjRoot231]|uniref:adenylate/guanylate cyclase domain-containing protein n=1 Tax=Phyllobacterium sp. LjRoot231 TaxID=3342289 RepID=UPI003ECFC2A8